jgi:hypothetical protein
MMSPRRMPAMRPDPIGRADLPYATRGDGRRRGATGSVETRIAQVALDRAGGAGNRARRRDIRRHPGGIHVVAQYN